MTARTQASVLRRRQGFAVVGFWIAQLFLGVPSILTAAHLVTTGKAEGALYTICLFLAWIGSTLAVGVGSLLHGKSELDLPSVFKIEVHQPGNIPPEYNQEYMGFRFRQLQNGTIDVFTADGPRQYRKWNDFVRAISN